jgi:YVTN family beta-propeller protein
MALAVGVALTLVACASGQDVLVTAPYRAKPGVASPISVSDQRLDFPWVSILPPRGDDWWLGRLSSQRDAPGLRDLAVFGQASAPISLSWMPEMNRAMATVSILVLPAIPASGDPVLERVVEVRRARFRELGASIPVHAAPSAQISGTECLRYAYEGSVPASSRARRHGFSLEGRGIVCRHPAVPTVLVELAFSQSKDVPQPRPVDVAAEEFFEGMRFARPVPPVMSAAVPVARDLQALVMAAGSLWVASVSDGMVARVDPAGPTVLTTITVDRSPVGVAFDGRAVWVANRDSGTITRIDPVTNRVVGTIAGVGARPLLLAVGFGALWVTNSGDGTVSRIDLGSERVVATIRTGRQTSGVSVAEHGVWVANFLDGTLSRIDPRSNLVEATIKVGTDSGAVMATEDAVWVSNQFDGTVSRVDPATNTVVASVRVGAGPGAMLSSRGHIWVTNYSDGTVSRIDPRTNQVVGPPVIVGYRPISIAEAHGAIWVSGQWDGTLMRIDP